MRAAAIKRKVEATQARICAAENELISARKLLDHLQRICPHPGKYREIDWTAEEPTERCEACGCELVSPLGDGV